MNIYDRARQMLTVMVTSMLMRSEPVIDEYLIPPGAPVKSSGKGVNKMRAGVDRSSNYGQKRNAHKVLPQPCAYGVGDEVPNCCAYHLKQWRKLNPGNGRYVNETWKELGDSDFLLGKKPLFKRLWAFQEYVIEKIHRENGAKFELFIQSEDQEQIITVKDCLIDAQRVASRHMRLAHREVTG